MVGVRKLLAESFQLIALEAGHPYPVLGAQVTAGSGGGRAQAPDNRPGDRGRAAVRQRFLGTEQIEDAAALPGQPGSLQICENVSKLSVQPAVQAKGARTHL